MPKTKLLTSQYYKTILDLQSELYIYSHFEMCPITLSHISILLVFLLLRTFSSLFFGFILSIAFLLNFHLLFPFTFLLLFILLFCKSDFLFPLITLFLLFLLTFLSLCNDFLFLLCLCRCLFILFLLNDIDLCPTLLFLLLLTFLLHWRHLFLILSV